MENPFIIQSRVQMRRPNETILITDGQLSVTRNDKLYGATGKLFFKWMPSLTVHFAFAVTMTEAHEFLPDYFDGKQILISADGQQQYKCIMTGIYDNVITGHVVDRMIQGDVAIPVESIHFEIANFRNFHGEIVWDENMSRRNRIELTAGGYTILIDKHGDFDDKARSLSAEGGYFIMHSGKITKDNSSINYKQARKVFHTLRKFFGFVAGNKCGPIFLTGIASGNEIWKDYTPTEADIYRSVDNIFSDFGKSANKLWQHYYKISEDDSDAGCLDYVIHWYTEANKNAGYAEGAIILIQNALELLYNWQVVEKRRMIIEGDADNISAPNKIRLLLSTVTASDQIPQNLKSLIAYSKKHSLKDGPAVFTDLRNALVHSQESKRKRLGSADMYTRSEAVTLGLSWIEKVLLKLLNYEGEYLDRNRQLIGTDN